MIYFLYGENSYQAINKLKELKKAFLKKRGQAFLIEEVDGTQGASVNFGEIFLEGSLFSQTRLVIFREAVAKLHGFTAFLKERGESLKMSRNIYVFWEREPDKESLDILKKLANKAQAVNPLSSKELKLWLKKKASGECIKLSDLDAEVMIEEAGAGAEWALENTLEKMVLAPRGETPPGKKDSKPGFKESAASPFGFVEKIFSVSFGRAMLALKEAEAAGQDLQRLVYPLLWKAKQKKMPDAYWQGILAESAMRRDPKNAYEILEKFILALPDRQAGIKA